MWKMSIHRDLNPQPFEHESSPITTRPGLRAWSTLFRQLCKCPSLGADPSIQNVILWLTWQTLCCSAFIRSSPSTTTTDDQTTYINTFWEQGSCCGSVVRAVASNTWGLRIESSHRQTFNSQLYRKDENKEKEAANGPFKNTFWEQGHIP